MENELKQLREENAKLRVELEKYKRSYAKGANVMNAKLTPEERSARAKKAVEARIKKYGQKSRKSSEK